MRIWPVGGRPGQGLGGGDTHAVVQLPFSEFVRRAKADELQSVAIDGEATEAHTRARARGHASARAQSNAQAGSDAGLEACRERTVCVCVCVKTGTQINFSAKPGSPLLTSRPGISDASRVTFYTVRPHDYAMP